MAPGAAPNAQTVPGPEEATLQHDHLVAGRPWTYVRNVSRPTMTVYSPTGKNTGAAVVVFPGGGYRILAIDLEEQCDLADEAVDTDAASLAALEGQVARAQKEYEMDERRQLPPRLATI